jgi:hypothetical protein
MRALLALLIPKRRKPFGFIELSKRAHDAMATMTLLGDA